MPLREQERHAFRVTLSSPGNQAMLAEDTLDPAITGSATIMVTAHFFDPPISTPTRRNPDAVAVADFDGDGTLDLVTADFGSNDVTVLLNAGDWPAAPARGAAPGQGARNGRKEIDVGSMGGPAGQRLDSGDWPVPGSARSRWEADPDLPRWTREWWPEPLRKERRDHVRIAQEIVAVVPDLLEDGAVWSDWPDRD